MKKPFFILFAVLIGLVPSSILAQTPPAISISLSFSQDYHGAGQAVPATIAINNTGSQVYLNSDFTSRNYYLELKIIDPAGRVVPGRRPADATPHSMQPLAFCYDPATGRVYEVGPCVPVASGPLAILAGGNVDLRQYYDLSLPGRYLAQVHLSVMQYADGACDMNAYLWQGALDSNVATFYMAGDAQVSISPAVWPLTWKDAASVPEAVTVSLAAPAEVASLETRAIYLNDVYSGNATPSGNSLVLSFDGRKAIDSLGTLEPGKTYKVRVAGWYKGGGFFGGTTQIKASTTRFQGFFSPVDNLPTVNAAKAGQTVPVKWYLADAAGQPVTDAASFAGVTSSTLNCSTLAGEPESVVETYSGSSGLQNLGGGNWQYNWKTSSGYANSCRTMVLTLQDGSVYRAYFKFRR